MKNKILILLVLTMLSCSAKKNVKTANRTIEPVTMSKDALYSKISGGVKESNLVITTEQEWKALIKQANLHINNFIVKEVDFKKDMIIAVFDKFRGSGAYSIKITEIKENTDNIRVSIKRTFTKGPSITVMSQPYHIVYIPKSSKKIVFVSVN